MHFAAKTSDIPVVVITVMVVMQAAVGDGKIVSVMQDTILTSNGTTLNATFCKYICYIYKHRGIYNYVIPNNIHDNIQLIIQYTCLFVPSLMHKVSFFNSSL